MPAVVLFPVPVVFPDSSELLESVMLESEVVLGSVVTFESVWFSPGSSP